MEDDDNYGDGEIEGEGWKMMTTMEMGRLRVKGGR